MGQRLFGAAAAVAIGAMLSPGQAFAQPAPADDSLAQFENLLRDPDAVATNLAYARTLLASGDGDQAGQVYRKVLALDPNNATAKAGVAALAAASAAAPLVAAPTAASAGAAPLMQAPLAAGSAKTDYTLRVGGAYESNSARLPPTVQGFDDEVLAGEFTVNDTRQIGDIALQSNLGLYSNFHNRFSPDDLTYVSLDSGPVFDLQAAGKLRVAIGGEYVLQGQPALRADGAHIRQFSFDAGNLILNYFPPGKSPLQSVNALVGYDHFRPSQSVLSDVVARVTAPLVFSELLPIHSELIATPGYVRGVAEVSTAPALASHYDEIDLDLLTLTPLADHALGAERVVGKLGLFLDTQVYDAPDPGMTGDRLDFQVIPLAGIRLVNFLAPHVDIDFDYRYDRNFSNDPAQRYTDHIVSLTATYRF